MVIILISFIIHLKRMTKGYVLSDNELAQIKAFLGYSFNLYVSLPLGIIFILLITVTILFVLNITMIAILLLFLIILIAFYTLPVFFLLYRKLYNKALISCLKVKLNRFVNKSLIYTSYKVHSNYQITKDKVYFFYDDYYFYIVEDLLIREGQFCYLDTNSLNKDIISFKLSDIISFVVDNRLVYNKDTFQDLLNKNVDTKEYAKIDLKNFKSIGIGYEVGLVLNEKIPYLNEYDK